MEISVSKIVGKEFSDKACSFTVSREVHPDLSMMYRMEHSPIRTQIFWVEMFNIPTFASVHLVRHKIGVEHFVKSNREDRPGHTGDTGRDHPVNHAMLINAQALINMCRKRLCNKSHQETQYVVAGIKHAISFCDTELFHYLVPECEYRGKCVEQNSCGRWAKCE